eukprot:1906627-Alexandrium_andersonii.AAC.1
MSASLVGSEMCIRDSVLEIRRGEPAVAIGCVTDLLCPLGVLPRVPRAVSYTHLTLPTICSV